RDGGLDGMRLERLAGLRVVHAVQRSGVVVRLEVVREGGPAFGLRGGTDTGKLLAAFGDQLVLVGGLLRRGGGGHRGSWGPKRQPAILGKGGFPSPARAGSRVRLADNSGFFVPY